MKKIYIILIVSLLIMAGCTTPQPPPQTGNATMDNHTTLCSDKQCFIAAANDCNKTDISVTENIGLIQYSSSTDCVFTKTLVKLDDNETQDMKNILEGKNMTCVYQKGQFDSRLVNTLIGGTETCDGELKTNLVKLAVFS